MQGCEPPWGASTYNFAKSSKKGICMKLKIKMASRPPTDLDWHKYLQYSKLIKSAQFLSIWIGDKLSAFDFTFRTRRLRLLRHRRSFRRTASLHRHPLRHPLRLRTTSTSGPQSRHSRWTASSTTGATCWRWFPQNIKNCILKLSWYITCVV